MTFDLRILALAATTSFALPALAAAQAAPDGAQAPDDGRVGLAAAIDTARAQLDGGVLDAELEAEEDSLVYEIEIVSDGAVHEIIVDAQSGAFVSINEQTLEGTWRGWFDVDRIEAAASASAGLTEALAAAEEQLGGEVTEASLEEEDGNLYYELEIATEAGDREAVVNTVTGEVTAGELDD